MELAITENKMTLKEITDLLEVRHDKAMNKVATMAADDAFGTVSILDIVYNDKGQTVQTYELNKRQSIAVASRLNTALLMRIIDRWEELEKAVKTAIPNFSDPVEAAQAWIEEYKAKQLAIATKAEIGHRREATAMNTASQAVKKANKLEIELDKSKEYCTVKRMEMIMHGQKFNWRLLKSACIELGIQAIDVFDANYGKVKAYHKKAWQEAYGLELEF